MSQVHRVYFLGIGGIGMSALARWFMAHDFEVAGYDKTSTPLTDSLIEAGAQVHFEDDMSLIPDEFKTPAEDLLVIYTPAIPSGHSELQFYQNNEFHLYKRSKVLGLFTEDTFCVAVAGTHGKTTTSSLVAHILMHANFKVTAFLGGIARNYGSNTFYNVQGDSEAIVVVEADEFDRSFLSLSPNVAIVTNVDPDHLDIYDDQANFEQSFKDFMDKVAEDGKLILNNSVDIDWNGGSRAEMTYGLGSGDARAENVRVEDGTFAFDFHNKDVSIEGFKLMLPGFHNVENSVAAIESALTVGVKPDVVLEAINCFEGVNRRFEFKHRAEGLVMIDDYAHHPTEIKSFIASARELYPGKHLTVVFQPHLYSRTRDFMDDFAKELSAADKVLLLPIYPARELPMAGITSDVLLAKMTIDDKQVVSKTELTEYIKSSRVEVLATLGAGDIDKELDTIKEAMIASHA